MRQSTFFAHFSKAVSKPRKILISSCSTLARASRRRIRGMNRFGIADAIRKGGNLRFEFIAALDLRHLTMLSVLRC